MSDLCVRLNSILNEMVRVVGDQEDGESTTDEMWAELDRLMQEVAYLANGDADDDDEEEDDDEELDFNGDEDADEDDFEGDDE